MITERECISLLLDPRVRSKAKGYLEKWMFESDLYREISFALFKPELEEVVPDRRLTITIVQSNNSKISGESVFTEVDQLISNHTNFNDNQIKAAISLVQEFIQGRLIAKSVDLAANVGVKEAIPILNKAVTLSLAQTDDIWDLSNPEHVAKLHQNDFPPNFKPIKSSFVLVNHCSSYSGYKYGDLALYSAAPGVGKTTALICEGACFLQQGLKVFHMVIGDMSGFDVFAKYAARILEVDIADIIANPVKYCNNPELKNLLSNLRVDAVPSFKYNSDQVISRCKAVKQDHNFDVVILDYDSNVAQTNTDSMYLEGGYSYGLYKALAVTERCVFLIASQPKIEYWSHEIVPVNAASESSRKQHHVDFMITMGRKQNSSIVGTMNMAKVRRGLTGKMARIRFDGHMSSITEIYQSVYDDLSAEESKKDKSDIVI